MFHVKHEPRAGNVSRGTFFLLAVFTYRKAAYESFFNSRKTVSNGEYTNLYGTVCRTYALGENGRRFFVA